MVKARRVGHATFETPDLEKAIAYYGEFMGLIVAEREKDRAFLATKIGQLVIELAEKLDDLIIGIAMVGGDVVPRPMPQRTPDDRYLFLAHHVAGVLKVHEILKLEGDVMQLHV